MFSSNNSEKSSYSLLFPEPNDNTKTDNISKTKFWKMMVIDDEEVLHALTRMVFKDFTFNGRGLEIISAYSKNDAKRLLDKHPDTQVLLLDVVMETDDAGLQLVHYVRNELKNQFVRIILRTGQPGQAPETQVIVKYDINDYKDKSDLTAQKLITAVIYALRSYNDLKRIEQLLNEIKQKNQQLEQEIAERRRSEEKMRQLSSALEQTADLVMITDKEGIIEYVNHGFETVTGYSKVEVLGKKANILKSEKQARFFYKILWETILKGEVFSEILINRKKDGEDFYEEKTISPLKDSQGNITHFISTGKDISERMAAQERNKPHNDAKAIEPHAIESQLENGLEKPEFVIHSQPQLDLQTGEIVDVIAVNLSLVQLKQQDLLQNIEPILNETEFPSEHLIFEINEGILKNVTGLNKILQDLHIMGFKLSINNFGTGYSSMNSLKRLPIDMIKIERNIISELTQNSDNALICSGIITLAHALNWKVIAEGVETPEQLEILKAHNCDAIQGDLCSPPLSVDKY